MVTGLVAIENVIDEQIKNTCRILIDKSDLRPGILVFEWIITSDKDFFDNLTFCK
ncbi:MAG: hypothetical protein WAP54_02880 [Bacteroidales bacterium]